MKHPFFKSVLVLAAALALTNCSEDTISRVDSNDEFVTPDYCWVLNTDQTLLIYATGIVTDANGNPVGVLNDTQNAIVSLDGTQFIVTNVQLGTLTILEPGSTVPEYGVQPSSSAAVIPPSSSSVNTPASSATVNIPASSSSAPNSSANVQNMTSSSQQLPQSSSSSQQLPKSSSSSQQQPKSSSSQQSGNLLPKIINGNKKYGYATRYWDSCKPHCAWDGKGGPVATTCKTDGETPALTGAASVCDDNGKAGTCFNQAPQIVNDTIAYAFAATPGGGNDCGKCYMLTFNGQGGGSGSSTPDALGKIRGKHLIVMANNIGYDVQGGQFDVMIPGGGPGKFNGCGKMGISCKGAQYGGFLTSCGFSKSCLIQMCNSEYSNPDLKNGCLFLANWMEGADNPAHEYVEVECPAALVDRY